MTITLLAVLGAASSQTLSQENVQKQESRIYHYELWPNSSSMNKKSFKYLFIEMNGQKYKCFGQPGQVSAITCVNLIHPNG